MTGRVGQQLGNYRLILLLGHGGFAEVYLGQHIWLNIQAAIKVLHTQLADDYDTEHFQREAQAIASLSHPHIVRVLDFDVEAGVPFLVMDYAPNGTLRHRHPKGVQLPLDTVLTYVKPVAAALQYAHEHKLVHRDVKPENMLLGSNHEVLLTDFGIAIPAWSSRLQSMQQIAGTAKYMAPEQFQGKPRFASDQYAFAVVVYEWLSGGPPFRGTFTELYTQHLLDSPPPLCEKIPTLALEVEQVVLRALFKDPNQRFASVQAFASALEQASRAESPQLETNISGGPVPSQLLEPVNVISPGMPVSPMLSVSTVNDPVLSPNQSWQYESAPQMRNTEPAQQGISRRSVVVGLGVTGVIIVGGLTWLVTSRTSLSSLIQPAPSPRPTPTPQPIPLGKLLYTYRGHTGSVNALAWSPNGERIVSGSTDTSVQVWDAADGRHVYTYRGHHGGVNTVAWSPNGKRIVSGSYDSTAQVWDSSDGSNVFIYRGHEGGQITGVNGVAWSPDGKRIASGGGNTTQVWNATDGGNVFTYRGQSVGASCVAWSPNGKRIVTGSYDKTVQVWDAADGGNVFIYRGHSDYIATVVWSPDGKRIASGSQDKTVQVWNATDGGNAFTYRRHSAAVYGVAWSPDGRRIVSGSQDSIVQIWGAG